MKSTFHGEIKMIYACNRCGYGFDNAVPYLNKETNETYYGCPNCGWHDCEQINGFD
jgi:DNA-directed RNA polymerase subunit RPC12/RpoP